MGGISRRRRSKPARASRNIRPIADSIGPNSGLTQSSKYAGERNPNAEDQRGNRIFFQNVLPTITDRYATRTEPVSQLPQPRETRASSRGRVQGQLPSGKSLRSHKNGNTLINVGNCLDGNDIARKCQYWRLFSHSGPGVGTLVMTRLAAWRPAKEFSAARQES